MLVMLMVADWGNALLNIVKYAPDEANNIKSAIAKAFDSIQKEFDEL